MVHRRGACFLAMVVLLLTGRTGWTQQAPEWLLQGNHAAVFDLVASSAETVTVIGSGAFDAGVVLGGVALMGDDGTSALIAAFTADGAFSWGGAGAFRGGQDGSYPAGRLILGFEGAVDALGNVYTSEGYPFALDSGMLTGGGVSLNKYAPDGTSLWTVPLHTPVADPVDQPGFAVGLGLDRAGNLYTAGIYRDTLLLAPDTLVAFLPEAPGFAGDVFLASYTSEGVLRWSRRIGGPRMDVIAAWADPHGAFTVDGEGNTYLGGFFGAGAVFGEGQTGAVTFPEDAYALASYDASGQLVWVRTAAELGIGDNAGPWRLAVDAEGNLFVDWFVLSSGSVNTVAVGDTTFTDPGSGGEFLTKLSPDGAILWAHQLKSDGNETVSDLVTDARGHVYVAGVFDGFFLTLEGEQLRKQDLQADGEDGFVAHYDAEGRLRWTGHAAGEGTQRIHAVAVSATGDLFVAGEFEQTLRLGGEILEAQGGNLFVAKYAAATITAGEAPAAIPAQARLAAAYPNPFRETTTIRFEVPEAGPVRLVVYDVLGREVTVPAEGVLPAGAHQVTFTAGDLPSGLYFYRLTTAGGSFSKMMTRVK